MPARAKRKAVTRKPIRRSKPAPKVTALTKPEPPTIAESIEKVLIGGDLSPLSPEQRVEYMKAVCKSLGLNPLTGPFGYILFKETESAPAKLALYAKKDAAEQLRKIHRVSVVPNTTTQTVDDDFATTRLSLRDGSGRTDTATGIVYLWKKYNNQPYRLSGQRLGDAIMKSETKAKRRGTLSICGLGMLDEMDLESVRVVGGVTPDGRIYTLSEPPLEHEQLQLSEENEGIERLKAKGLWCDEHGCPRSQKHLEQCESNRKASEVDRQVQKARDAGITNQTLKEAEERQEAYAEVPKASKPPITAPTPLPAFAGPTLEAEAVGLDRFRVMGDIQDTYPMIEHYCTLEDGFWYTTLAKLEEMRGLQEKFKFRLTVVPSTKPAGKGPAEKKATAPASGSQTPVSPTVVSGTLLKSIPGLIGSKPIRDCTIMLTDTNGKTTKPTYRTWDKKWFEELDKNVGKEGVFILKKSKDGKWTNIEGLRKLGSKEWLEDGTPAIQQKDREAGGRTLFGQ
jgi:hypothetical protein